MKATLLVSLALAASAIAGPSSAQVPRGYTPQSADMQKLENNTALSAKRYQDGVDALNAKNFAVAEAIFDEVLRENGNHPEANFMMGVAKMSLGKWAEAKSNLEIAVKKKPKEPDPKSRLGVTLIKLGDAEGAKKQRDDLVKLQKACNGNCKNAAYIDRGIAMIDATKP
ncbi:MAG: tetratricopeptide repeat protein [Hyphomonadaceae bacterium]